MLKKLYLWNKVEPSSMGEKTRVLIWGAGDCGELCLRFLQKERQPSYDVLGFIDDNPRKRGKRLRGVKVLGIATILKLFLACIRFSRCLLRFPLLRCKNWRKLWQPAAIRV